jgi:hypothetical protein
MSIVKLPAAEVNFEYALWRNYCYVGVPDADAGGNKGTGVIKIRS